MTLQKIDFAALMRLALASNAVTAPCSCITVPLTAWQALPLSLELERFEDVGTMLDDPYDEPTFAEFHPAGTHYSDASARRISAAKSIFCNVNICS